MIRDLVAHVKRFREFTSKSGEERFREFPTKSDHTNKLRNSHDKVASILLAAAPAEPPVGDSSPREPAFQNVSTYHRAR